MKLVELLGIPDKGDVFNVEAKVKTVYKVEAKATEYSSHRQNIILEEGPLEVKTTLWDCEEVSRSAVGKTIKFSAAKKGSYEGKPQLNVSKEAKVEVIGGEPIREPVSGVVHEVVDRDISFDKAYAKDIIVARINKGHYDGKENVVIMADWIALIKGSVNWNKAEEKVETGEVNPF
jgi:ssDNA-binding replication factor A large subunit